MGGATQSWIRATGTRRGSTPPHTRVSTSVQQACGGPAVDRGGVRPGSRPGVRPAIRIDIRFGEAEAGISSGSLEATADGNETAVTLDGDRKPVSLETSIDGPRVNGTATDDESAGDGSSAPPSDDAPERPACTDAELPDQATVDGDPTCGQFEALNPRLTWADWRAEAA